MVQQLAYYLPEEHLQPMEGEEYLPESEKWTAGCLPGNLVFHIVYLNIF